MIWPDVGPLGCVKRRLLATSSVPSRSGLLPSIDELQKFAAGRELMRRATEEALSLFVPMAHQVKFLMNPAREKWFVAGNRSAKTVTGAVETDMTAFGIHPVYDYPAPNKQMAVALDLGMAETISLDKIMEWLPHDAVERMPSMMTNDKTLVIKKEWGGSEIDFRSCDQGREKVQAGAYHRIWADEELPDREFYEELMTRLIDYKGAFSATMTPLKGLTWVYTDIILRDRTTPNPRLFVMSATMMDNTTLSAEEIGERSSGWSETTRRARLFGEFIDMGGQCVFDRLAIQERRGQVTEPVCKMRWEDLEEGSDAWKSASQSDKDSFGMFVPCGGGDLWIYDRPTPQDRYGIGVDVSAGLVGGDSACVEVGRASDSHQVAEFLGTAKPYKLAHMTAWLGRWYGMGRIAVEVTGIGSATEDRLEEVYPKHLLYRRITQHRDDGDLAKQRFMGFATTPTTKPIAVEDMREWFDTDPSRVQSPRLLGEMGTFVSDGAKKTGALAGCRDDSVMATAVMLQMLKQIPGGEKLVALNSKTREKDGFRDESEKQTIGNRGLMRSMRRFMNRWAKRGKDE